MSPCSCASSAALAASALAVTERSSSAFVCAEQFANRLLATWRPARSASAFGLSLLKVLLASIAATAAAISPCSCAFFSGLSDLVSLPVKRQVRPCSQLEQLPTQTHELVTATAHRSRQLVIQLIAVRLACCSCCCSFDRCWRPSQCRRAAVRAPRLPRCLSALAVAERLQSVLAQPALIWQTAASASASLACNLTPRFAMQPRSRSLSWPAATVA